MALALEARAKADDIMVGDTPKALRRRRRLRGVQTAGRLWKHSSLAQAEGLISRAQMEEYFVFTIVRNPWDRIVSLYHWLQVQDFDHPSVALAKSLGFSAFLNTPFMQLSIRGHPFGGYVCDGAGQNHCDLFVRLEHLTEDLAPLEAHLGLPLGCAPQQPKRAAAGLAGFLQ